MQKPNTGDVFVVQVMGKPQQVKVLAVYSFGTMDIETASGRCYRITGLSWGLV